MQALCQTRAGPGSGGSYLTTFLISRKKASLADVQKFFPYIAICKTWSEPGNFKT